MPRDENSFRVCEAFFIIEVEIDSRCRSVLLRIECGCPKYLLYVS